MALSVEKESREELGNVPRHQELHPERTGC